MFWKLAWRNLWRNRTRTLLSGLVIAFGLASLVFVDGIMVGMSTNMIKNATDTLLGQAQLHRRGFRDEMDVKLSISGLGAILDTIKRHPDMDHWSARVVTQAILSSSEGAEPVMVLGVDPSREKPLSKFDDGLVKGNYLSAADSREMILGDKLAEKLELDLGERLVLTAIDAESGEMVQELFRLSGVFYIGTREMDASVVVAPLQTVQKMLVMGSNVHEIALRFASLDRDGNIEHPLKLPKADIENELLTWSELMPALKIMMQWSDLTMVIVGLVLFFIIGLGITNTLLMGLYERMFELGVIKSLGTTPLQASRLMIYEAACLGVFSTILGILISVIVMTLSHKYGIDYTGIEFSGVTFQEKIYPELRWDRLVQYPFWTMGFTLVASLYPAWKLLRMLPVEAMRKRKF